jgi:hypothetical protein
MDEIVRPEMKDSWYQIKSKWFADETPQQQKEPGLLKEEFSTKTGVFVALRLVNFVRFFKQQKNKFEI